MDGMLESTLVARRFDQKPSWISTALTGMLRSLAWGERETSITPAVFQDASESLAELSPAGDGNAELMRAVRAAVAAADARNLRREIRGFMGGSGGCGKTFSPRKKR